MSNELPEGYKEGITRVSNIVSFRYPFSGTDAEKRYLDWLADDVNPKWARGYAINPKEYIEEACDVGTFIHLQMEKHALGKRMQRSQSLYKKHLGEIEGGKEYIDRLKALYPDVKWIPEQVIRDSQDRFQGTIDLIRVDEETKTVWLYDWKTFGIAKKRWNLNNVYKKPSAKLPKVGLQMSLYAETYRQKGYTVGGVYCLYLHESGCYEYECKLEESAEIDNLLSSYKEEQIRIENVKTLINNNEYMSFDLPFKIEILEPTKQFGNIKLNLDLGTLDNGKTDKENIDELIKKAKYVSNKCKD